MQEPERAEPGGESAQLRVLVVDVGGNNVKVRRNGDPERRKHPSGPDLTPERMVEIVRELTRDWSYDRVSIGFPGPVRHDQPTREPVNLGEGWVGFEFEAAFGCPVRVVNDAAMQALGSYEGGTMLFLGLGTGLGSALVSGGRVQPLELAHLPYKKGRSFEDYVGRSGLEKRGKKKWRKAVHDVVERLAHALQVDYVVLGGGNLKELDALPEGARPGANANAFLGGFRLWGVEEERGGP
jgi:polyphosphate glucokinase